MWASEIVKTVRRRLEYFCCEREKKINFCASRVKKKNYVSDPKHQVGPMPLGIFILIRKETTICASKIAEITTHRMEATMEAGAATTGVAPAQDSRPATDTRAAAAGAGRGRSMAAAVSTAGRITAAAGTAESPISQGLLAVHHSTMQKDLFLHGSGTQNIPSFFTCSF